MDIAKCEVLLRAVDAGSFSAAAAKLGYTPSGVVRMVNSLEAEVGFPLVARSSHGITLTENGREMLPLFRQLIYWHKMARQRSSAIRGLDIGNLDIGTYFSVAAGWLPEIIRQFQADYPHITIHTMEAGTSELIHWVEERRVDFGIVSKRDIRGEWISLKRDPMMVWLPRNHRLAGLEAVPVRELEGEAFIMPMPKMNNDTEKLLADDGVCPDIKFTTIDNYTAYCMVGAGLGISINNELMTRDWTGNVVIKPLDPPHYIELGIAISSYKDASPAAQKFITYIRRTVQE